MISQCGSHQQLRRALELVAEMRSRGIDCNVHTYSALMNVCIKANELDLAQDVYKQMLEEGCSPNLVRGVWGVVGDCGSCAHMGWGCKGADRGRRGLVARGGCEEQVVSLRRLECGRLTPWAAIWRSGPVGPSTTQREAGIVRRQRCRASRSWSSTTEFRI